MKQLLGFISIMLIVLLFGFGLGYVYIKVQEANCDEEIKKAECYVDGGWNCE